MEKRDVYVRITQDELGLLDIIKQSTDLRMYRHECTREEAKMYVEMYGEPVHKIANDVEWYETIKRDYDTGRSVQVIGFVETEKGEEE